MRIVFICNCLEPGRDGVGDYTRRLGEQIVVLGHNAAAIALNDDFVSAYDTDNASAPTGKLQILRIPASLSLKERTALAKKFTADFNPDWVSLQFVIFGYHAKGLPFGLGKQLKALAPGKNWSIMFHELWVAMEQEAQFKHNIWGHLQRLIIKSLLKALQPKVVFTHTSLYISELKELGVAAFMLPLFGNIPRLSALGAIPDRSYIDVKQPLNMVLFGNIHTHTPVNSFAAEAAAFSSKYKVPVNLLLSGRNGTEQQLWVNEWKAAGLNVKVLGEQAPEDISALFSAAVLGISTTPVAVIEKSGSVAAMHEHRLTVLNVSAQWQPKNFKPELPQGIIVYEKGNLEQLLTGKLSLPVMNTVGTIARQFINQLQTNG